MGRTATRTSCRSDTNFRVGDWLVSPRLNRVEGNGRAVRLEPKHRSPAEITAGARPVHAATMAPDDPFPKYNLSAWNSFCNQPALSVVELRRAIEQNYCAYPQMETDPLLENMRKMPVFAELRAAGIACQKRFLEHRKQSD